jgi:hypothetical protein
MTPDARELCMLNHEGQTLHMAGSHGKEYAIDVAHCVVDGIMNALIKIEGPEAAAQFAFALSDRVVGRVRLPSMGEKLPEPLPRQVPPPIPASTWAWAHGCLVGFVVGVIAGLYGRSA